MNSDAQNIDKIDRYLNNEMDEEELRTFEDLLAEDESLKKEVALQRDLAAGISLYGAESLKKQLQSVDSAKENPFIQPEQGNSQNDKTRLLNFIIAVAASFALVVAAIWLIYPVNSSQDLYMAYYEPYPNVISPAERSGAAPDDASSQAMYLYTRGKYEEAITAFSQLPLENEAYRFYLGVSFLGAQQPQQAEQTLQPLLSNSDGAFYEPALWYVSLAQLANSQPQQASATLNEVVALQGEYTQDAKQLLQEIKATL